MQATVFESDHGLTPDVLCKISVAYLFLSVTV